MCVCITVLRSSPEKASLKKNHFKVFISHVSTKKQKTFNCKEGHKSYFDGKRINIISTYKIVRLFRILKLTAVYTQLEKKKSTVKTPLHKEHLTGHPHGPSTWCKNSTCCSAPSAFVASWSNLSLSESQRNILLIYKAKMTSGGTLL